MLPTVDELLALDWLTLRTHTEQAGDTFDFDERRVKLQNALAVKEVCTVRRESKLVAYALLRPEAGACWFVSAFGIRPSSRTYTVISELLAKIAILSHDRRIDGFRSHVYKTNRLSIAFHRKLGFHVTRENEKGFEFFVTVHELTSRPATRRAATEISRFQPGSPE
ncbi:GNAT family N-acetyltransferase [Paraburkholderia bannensis]|uniref:GNAT family N-acetyltransferase n=1 Tax=Paraburkholderia bannensis TaxID=765414 RepID=UPI0038B8A3A5